MKYVILTDNLNYDKDLKNQYNLVIKHLKNRKIDFVHLTVSLNFKSLKKQLLKINPIMAINLVESIDFKMQNLSLVLKLLESLNIPFTGSGSFAIENTTNKCLCRKICDMNKLPIPKESSLYIVKSIYEHGSFGIENSNIVKKIDSEKKIKELELKFKTPFFKEAFIIGKEFTVSFLNETIFNPVEIILSTNNDILTNDKKWKENYKENFDINDEVSFKLKFISSLVIKSFDLKSYGRIDFRIDENNNIYIIDINANPCIDIQSTFIRTLQYNNISYEKFLDIVLYIDIKLENFPILINKKNFSIENINFKDSINFEEQLELKELFKSVSNFTKEDFEVFSGVLSEIENKEEDYFVILIKQNNISIGICIYVNIPLSNDVYEIYWIFINENIKNKGYGSFLLNTVENEIKKKHGKILFLDTELHYKYKNTIEFYLRNNFIIDTIEPNFYGSSRDKIIFKKYLNVE